jgi:hypothetical protein
VAVAPATVIVPHLVAETSDLVIAPPSGPVWIRLGGFLIIGSCGETVPERDAKPLDLGRPPDAAQVAGDQSIGVHACEYVGVDEVELRKAVGRATNSTAADSRSTPPAPSSL